MLYVSCAYDGLFSYVIDSINHVHMTCRAVRGPGAVTAAAGGPPRPGWRHGDSTQRLRAASEPESCPTPQASSTARHPGPGLPGLSRRQADRARPRRRGRHRDRPLTARCPTDRLGVRAVTVSRGADRSQPGRRPAPDSERVPARRRPTARIRLGSRRRSPSPGPCGLVAVIGPGSHSRCVGAGLPDG